MEAALIALAGVLIGVLLGEHFRRSHRVEIYSEKLFDRRLEVYERLMQLVQNAYSVASAVVERNDLTHDERHQIVSGAIHEIATYVDANELFVDSYIGAHVTGMIMGTEDIADIVDESEKQLAIARFRAGYVVAKKMIREESGVEQINRYFKLVSKSKPDSPMIRLLKHFESKNDA